MSAITFLRPPGCRARVAPFVRAALAGGGLALSSCVGMWACGSSGDARATALVHGRRPSAQPLFDRSHPASGRCTQAALGALASVAKRVYDEGNGGRIARQALARLERSSTLRQAVEAGDPRATRHALQHLADNQIVRASVERGSTTLADVGNHDAIAPVEGTITSSTGAPVARVRVSVLGGQGYAATLVGLISAHTVVRAGGVQLGSTLEGSRTISLPSSGVFTQGHATYQVASFPVAAFAAAGARAYLLLAPPAASLCAKDPAQTSLDALAAVAERIYMGEQVGGKAVQAIDVAESSGPFKHAVAAGDRAATRAAIIEFFANRSHVVRVRVYRHGQLLIDVGGPHVLAPAWGTLNAPDGSRAGTFELAVQDDEGYLLLAHAFTGAEILLRTDHGQVMGTLSPGPTSIPDRGVLTYKGVRYHAYSFDGEAFPSGRLHISLLARG